MVWYVHSARPVLTTVRLAGLWLATRESSTTVADLLRELSKQALGNHGQLCFSVNLELHGCAIEQNCGYPGSVSTVPRNRGSGVSCMAPTLAHDLHTLVMSPVPALVTNSILHWATRLVVSRCQPTSGAAWSSSLCSASCGL